MDFLKSNGARWVLLFSLVAAGGALSGAGCGDDGAAGSGGSAGSSGSTGSAGAGGGMGGAGGGMGGEGGAGGGGGGPVDCTAGTANPLPGLKLTLVVDNLSRPVLATGAPKDTARLFIIEKPGRIRIFKDGNLLPESFIDLTSVVDASANERGLLGMAFHPNYDQNGRFFVYYTRKPDGALTIAEYARSSGSADTASTTVVKEFVTIQHPKGNHNGGNLAFGPDGFLYAGTGDGGGADDPDGNGQNTDQKLGKMLRFNVDTYPTPPPGNLTTGDQDIWDWGLRNPWRFSFDRCSGDLYIADVGQNVWEEIDVEPKGEGNKNYGWNTMEASACFNPSSGCDTTGLTLPVAEYQHGGALNDCSVTGGYVYRGAKIPALVGTYLYADYCSKRVWSLAWSKGQVIAKGELTTDLDSLSLSAGITSFGEDTSGELYVVIDNSQGGQPGAVYRIDAD